MARAEPAPDASVSGGRLLPREASLPPVPLEHTTITVEVVGPLAETIVTQRFRNRHHAALDALYVFPLPSEAAVSALELRVGERLICGTVQPRAEARRLFDQAAEQGHDAALLAQERPNMLSVEVANLQPDEIVEVRLGYFERVPYDDGWFTLVVPTVVLPRYLPGGALANPKEGAVPLLPPGVAGHTLSVEISLDVGRLAEIDIPDDQFEVREARGRHIATLRDPVAVPDRDLVLRYRPAGAGYRAATFVYREAGRPGALLLSLTPQAVPALEEVLPREMLFVFDRSGSMGGESIVQARNALRACLRALNPGDSFNIFPFDNFVERLAPTPLPFTQANVDAADRYIAGIEARGGTEIVAALAEALAQPRDPKRLRVVVFLTDGAVGNENLVLRELTARLGEARVFAFGVGSAVNRFLLDKLAEVGRGVTEYILPGEAIELAVERFQRRAALPLLRDLHIEWGGAHVSEVLPTPLPDLYAGQPLIVMARFNAPHDERALLTLKARAARGSFAETLVLDLPASTPDRGGVWAALPKLWARARIAALEDTARLEPRHAPALEQEILALALEHGLLSSQTAFVAVEAPPPNTGRQRAEGQVVVPVHLPAGARREAFEGSAAPALLGGVMYAASAMPSFRAPLGRFLARAQSVGETAPSMPRTTRGAPPAAPRAAPAPVERRDAALRYLARTQAVNGSWAEDEQATALAALAFALAGHTAHAGAFRPQLIRAARWLAAHAPARGALAGLARAALEGAPVEAAAAAAAAEATLRAAGLSRAEAVALQRLGGDADGAVAPPVADPLRPTATTLALTAAVAILVVDESTDRNA
ncbi:MAG: VIT domain-containing protein [Oscillochloridaceae bacterium]|nr:VIT domain-containing protein [Chloroflexaceae bacterium]MDW8389534.1 VIT domain-containing protein [Oscillochloridaceae bacterium]